MQYSYEYRYGTVRVLYLYEYLIHLTFLEIYYWGVFKTYLFINNKKTFVFQKIYFNIPLHRTGTFPLLMPTHCRILLMDPSRCLGLHDYYRSSFDCVIIPLHTLQSTNFHDSEEAAPSTHFKKQHQLILAADV